MNVVDSSAWLEYLADTPAAPEFAPAIEDADHLLVPTITITEVFKRTLAERGESACLSVMAAMRTGQIIPLDEKLAESAARAGREHKLPLADSIILATAMAFGAELWTQDSDFKGLPGVRYIPRRELR